MPANPGSAAGGPSALAAAVQDALDAHGVAAALSVCEDRLRLAPADAGANRLLGILHALSGDHGAAIAAATRACRDAPDDPRNWSDLGRVHALLGDLEVATANFLKATEVDPGFADGWHNLGTVLRKLGRNDPAFTALKNALILDPARAETYLNLGALLVDAGQLEDALECYERAARCDPSLARARSRLARQLSGRGRVKRAESLFRQSLTLDPDHMEGWLGLGRALEDLGDAEGALGCYRNVLARRPGHATALGHYLALSRAEVPAGLLAHARTAVEAPDVKDEPRALIAYGLAKYHDRRGERAEAAAAARRANAARRSVIGALDRPALAARVDALIAHYDREFFAVRRDMGMGTQQPVFIVGLPRSGTTLTEQIIAAHPLLHGAGELPDLARLAARVAARENAAPWRAAGLLDVPGARQIGLAYLRALRDGAPRRRLRISDKSPLNFFQLALIAILFPNAAIIHCSRDPRDNGLSIWMENFNEEQRYATDFADLAFFVGQYRRLMAHWRAALPLKILEARYEDTVADPEGQARHIMEFLGVPWDRRCLDFHRSDRAVQTPSRWQVRQPIYTASVGRWRGYAEFLPELETAFAALVDVGGRGA